MDMGWDNWLKTPKFTQMRWNVEKGNILGWNLSNGWMLGLSLGFSIGTYGGNVVGVILGKVLGYTLLANDGMPLGWSLGPLLVMTVVVE